MKKPNSIQCNKTLALSLSLLLFLNTGCKKNANDSPVLPLPMPKGLQDYNQVNLVANKSNYNAVRVDTILKDAWGIAFSPTGNAWLSAEATGYSPVYDKEGNQLLAPVAIPSPTAATGGAVAGIVFNGTTDFNLPNSSPARFIFAGTDGVISGWNTGNTKAAVKMVNNSPTSVYTGLALASSQGVNYLYAANFKTGNIDVFDTNWKKVSKTFIDPALPSQYSPFNVQTIDDKLYITYAKVGPDGNEVHAAGLGLVDIFNTDGSFVKRFVSNGQLNSPWGITKAPAKFYGADSTSFANTILVGNFGDGHINTYSSDGNFLGQVQSQGKPLTIDGLWALSFAPITATTIDPTRLYFEAGPNSEKDGLFGYIKR